MAALLVANQLLMAAVKIWESDPDSPYVLGLTLNALAFISDAVGYAHIAGGDPSAIDATSSRKATRRRKRCSSSSASRATSA